MHKLMHKALQDGILIMNNNNKRMEAVGIQVDSNVDTDEFSQLIATCIGQLDPDSDVVGIVKIDFGSSHIPMGTIARFVQQLQNMFQSVNAKNCIFVPVGENMGIRDIRIDYVKVVTDESKER